MEALATSTFAAKLVEPSPWHQAHFLSLLKLPSLRLGFSRSHPIVVLRPSSRLCGCRALIHDVSDGGESIEASPGNGSGLPELEVGGDNLATAGKEEVIPPVSGASPTGSRAGLFRTPISGGVHSATSAHDLPPPALAVRNLMEQARFAHLCTVMSRMHHRRAGYPFGSLVDFAADSIGHPIFSLSPLAIHTRNLLADSRCTLVVQIPGWSGLSNARVTIFGDVFPLPVDKQNINKGPKSMFWNDVWLQNLPLGMGQATIHFKTPTVGISTMGKLLLLQDGYHKTQTDKEMHDHERHNEKDVIPERRSDEVMLQYVDQSVNCKMQLNEVNKEEDKVGRAFPWCLLSSMADRFLKLGCWAAGCSDSGWFLGAWQLAAVGSCSLAVGLLAVSILASFLGAWLLGLWTYRAHFSWVFPLFWLADMGSCLGKLKWIFFPIYRGLWLLDVYFIGGFGTVQWIDVKEYESLQPDKIAVDGGEQNLKELNAIFSKPLREILSTEGEIDDAALISVDSKGTDIRVRQGAQFNIQRLSFEVEHGVGTLEEAKKALQKIINRGCTQRKNYKS
ncbi:hypothetical protein M5K25_012013 [Dendrobium thyrsiflorum]|uniref:CREG-like beta-barrel domain-containing protein n=1 Tax=Dendrobium thyrsiflorum TaxID=117978 RepID=A0ABD0VBQ8_DENTH